MKEVARLLREMQTKKVIKDYAVFGAVAQMRYTEAVATMDADVLIVLPRQGSINLLKPVYEFCRSQGYLPEGEAIRVGDWPVQFIPVFNTLTEQAVRTAETGEIEGIPLKVASPDYLAAIALSTGRPKDYARILALLDSEAISMIDIERLAARHDLQSEWHKFRRRFLDE
ncbi:MAG: hypothetical protein FVQ80_18860 [Planctomycetes bacterium]|nr:hypothetical protein [Planctomycetota bacterium]